MIRKHFELVFGWQDEGNGLRYSRDESCYSCRRVFKPDDGSVPRMCREMAVRGVDDSEVHKDSVCSLFDSAMMC
jgi:hypothetical protein